MVRREEGYSIGIKYNPNYSLFCILIRFDLVRMRVYKDIIIPYIVHSCGDLADFTDASQVVDSITENLPFEGGF